MYIKNIVYGNPLVKLKYVFVLGGPGSGKVYIIFII